ncbi:PhoH family protein [Desulforhopalus sp. IMCC35007]|uniref:PhoH family protein n=1 Tax=Desulforhopalus sp. IMCC35007 TaxID=2569543 RepID=UPI0010AEE1B1|nr:PhoH family protein [Desulforhopalus sp. IMCC35007]TKB11713.1 PhoH family protein [Desulforhopalus sp. IMCC35007]
MTAESKIFVLDTNVILHDSSCIYNFQEHDIVIPITVLEELDNFKKGQQIINFHARQFVRSLDSLSSDKLFNGGMRIGPDSGRIAIRLEQRMHPDLKDTFPGQDKPDHRILNIAYCMAKADTEKSYVLVSKDVNLRMKAKSVGLMAEDYTTDHVRDLEKMYGGCREIEDVPAQGLDDMYRGDGIVAKANLMADDTPLVNNEYIILKNGKKSALAVYKKNTDTVERIHKSSAYGIIPRNAEQSFALNALLDPMTPLVSLTGKAGTGKTLLALAAALEVRKHYHQILLTRPIVPLSNKDIGYLPGDINSKISPYMQPLYDNLGVIKGQFSENSDMYSRLKRMLEDEKLMIEPLAYIRGRSLVKKYMIVDEAQNLTPLEVKTIVTRAGEGTKIVFTGDIEQIDHPYLDRNSNGLSSLVYKMQGQKLYAHVDLKKGERSELADLASDLL